MQRNSRAIDRRCLMSGCSGAGCSGAGGAGRVAGAARVRRRIIGIRPAVRPAAASVHDACHSHRAVQFRMFQPGIQATPQCRIFSLESVFAALLSPGHLAGAAPSKWRAVDVSCFTILCVGASKTARPAGLRLARPLLLPTGKQKADRPHESGQRDRHENQAKLVNLRRRQTNAQLDGNL